MSVDFMVLTTMQKKANGAKEGLAEENAEILTRWGRSWAAVGLFHRHYILKAHKDYFTNVPINFLIQFQWKIVETVS